MAASSPPKSITADSAVTPRSSRKRPRHFHQGPDQQEEEEEEEERIAAQPPATRLYRHALESIFAFLSLAELSNVLAVSRSWSAAVGSMRSIDVTILKPNCSMERLCASPLTRHIGCLGPREDSSDTSKFALVTCNDLNMLSLRMRNLHTLCFKLSSLLDASTLLFPSSLTWIKSEVPIDASDADINSLIRVISRIPKLQRVDLNLVHLRPDVSFAPFQSSLNLRELGMYQDDGKPYSPSQVDEIRAMSHLTHVRGLFIEGELVSLMRTPHQFQWTMLAFRGHVNEEMQRLLRSVPTLTQFSLWDCQDATFLCALPNLHTLKLQDCFSQQPLLSSTQFIEGVGQCAHLTHLSIYRGHINADQLCALPPCLPALTKLELHALNDLDSLRFLSTNSIRSTLRHFSLYRCCHPNLRVIECRHLFALLELTYLYINHSFSERLDSLTVLDLSSPSTRLLKLNSGYVKSR